jgi:hypothetical protein
MRGWAAREPKASPDQFRSGAASATPTIALRLQRPGPQLSAQHFSSTIVHGLSTPHPWHLELFKP